MSGGGGGIGSAVGGIVGGIVGDAKASGDRSQSQGYAEQAYNTLIGIGLPPDLSKEVVLQKFQEAGILTPEVENAVQLTHSAQAQLQEAPETREAQMEALQAFKQLGATGLGAQDRAALSQIRDQVQRDQEAKRQQILQSMQARGMGGSGAELIAQLQGSQGAANLASDQSLQVAAQAQQRALEALGQGANLAGSVRGQDYTVASNRARAEDEMNRFNVGAQQESQMRNVAARNVAQHQNLANKQAVMNANVGQANQELQRQNQAKQDYWNNIIKRAQVQSGGYQGMADEYAGRANKIAGKEQSMWTGIGGLAGTAADAAFGGGAGGGATTEAQMGTPTKENPMWYSDEKLKKNIHSGDAEIKEFLDNVEPYSYEYKDSNKHNVSPMAQDLEKSSIGKNAVTDTPKGKIVDYNKLIQSVVASQGYLHDEISKLKKHAEPKKAAFGGMIPGEAITKDNNFTNDLVNIQAAPGEIILPREITESSNPEDEAYEFVKKLLKKKKEGSEEEIIDPRAIDQDAVKLDKSLPGNLGKDDPAAINPNRKPPKDMGDVAPIDYKKDETSKALELMFGKNDVSTLKALEEAQQQRNIGNFASDIARSAALVSEGFSGIENKGLKEIADIQGKRAGQPIEDFKAKVEILKKDPNSSVSKGYKALLEKQMGMKLGGDVSASDIKPFLTASMKKSIEKQVLFQKGGVDASGNLLSFDPKTGQYVSTGAKAADQMFQVKDPLTGAVNLIGRRAPIEGGPVVKGTFGTPKEATGKEEGTHEIYSTLDDKSRTKVDKTREDFLKDTASDRDAIVASGGIKTMLAAGKEMNGDVLRAIQNQLARGNGEKGTMTEGDVQGFGGKADVLSRLGRYASMNLVGEMTSSDRQFLSKLADVMERRANDYVNQQSKVYSDNITKVTGLEDEKARTLLGVEKTMTSNRNKPRSKEASKKEQKKDDDKVTVMKDGKKFRLPKEQLKQALEQGYSLVEEE